MPESAQIRRRYFPVGEITRRTSLRRVTISTWNVILQGGAPQGHENFA